MAYFGKFYLDKEKDIIVTLDMQGDDLSYVITSPHHQTGNLITNLAKVCELEICYDDYGYKIIKGDVPCFYDGDNEMVYIYVSIIQRWQIFILMDASSVRPMCQPLRKH